MLRVGVIMYQTSLSKGQELVAQRMVREFKAQNYDAFLITSPYHDGELVVSEEEIAKRGGYVNLFDEKLGIPVIRVGSLSTSWPPRRVSLADFVNTLAQIVDAQKLNVLIVHSTLWNGPEDVLKFVEWRRNLAKDGFPQLTPIFCHMSHFQDASPERYDMVERSYRDAWNSTSLSQVVKGADLVLVVSPFEKEAMKQLGADESKCFLFPGGIKDTSIPRGGVERFITRHHLPPDAKLVTSLGTVEERKNTMAIVEVAKRLVDLHDVHFVIAGFEQGEYAKKVREEAARLPNLSMLGPLSEDDKSALIKATTVNLIMSRSEALGIAQLEFMANGVPVVSSGTGGQGWVVRDGKDGMIVDGPDDVSGAARAITKITENSSVRKRLGTNARRHASAYSMSLLVHQLAKRLENMVQQRADEERLRRGLPEKEEVLEAMVSGRTRVMVTNRRLMIKNDRSDRDPVSLNLKEIRRVVRKTLYPWNALAVGTMVAAALLVYSFFPGYAAGVERFLGATPLGQVGPILPALVAAGATVFTFGLLRRVGYVVETKSHHVFVPREFLRLLRLVDRLSPAEIFTGQD